MSGTRKWKDSQNREAFKKNSESLMKRINGVPVMDKDKIVGDGRQLGRG